MSKPECAGCFLEMEGHPCCGALDSDPPRCESCGVPYVKHLGLVGTCAEKTRYLSLLRRVIRMSCLTVERCPAGYPDVADFLREEEKNQ
jgi:hypothetical protein